MPGVRHEAHLVYGGRLVKMNVLLQVPVCEAIARHCRTWHHLTRTFQCVCRAWRAVAYEEAFIRVDRIVRNVHGTLVGDMWHALHGRPFALVHADGVSFECNLCDTELNARTDDVWFAYNHPSRDFDLCAKCYRGNGAEMKVQHDETEVTLQFINMSFGDDAPYCVFYIACYECMEAHRHCAPIRKPPMFRWPRHVKPPRPSRVLLACEDYFAQGDNGCNAISLSLEWYQYPSQESCNAHLGSGNDFFDDVARFSDTDCLERGSAFNILDWVPIEIEMNRATGQTIHHMVCVNPANTECYGRRARLDSFSWSWSHTSPSEKPSKSAYRKVITPSRLSLGDNADTFPSHNEICARAHQIWQATRREDALANWLQAELELLDAKM